MRRTKKPCDWVLVEERRREGRREGRKEGGCKRND